MDPLWKLQTALQPPQPPRPRRRAPAPARESAEPKRRFKWATSLDQPEQLSLATLHTRPPLDLDRFQQLVICDESAVQDHEGRDQCPGTDQGPGSGQGPGQCQGWRPRDGVRALLKSASGQRGVFFVWHRLPSPRDLPVSAGQGDHVATKPPSANDDDDGVSVLKAPGSQLHTELMATIIAQWFGIRTPRVRLIATGSQEGQCMLAALRVVDPLWQVCTQLWDQQWVMQKEFVGDGCGWGAAGLRAVVQSVMQSSLASTSLASSSPTSTTVSADQVQIDERLLMQIGRLMAVDVLLNNGDRLPLLWANQGNAANLFVVASVPDVAGLHGSHDAPRVNLDVVNVDATATPILSSPQAHQAYLERVRSFVRRVRHYCEQYSATNRQSDTQQSIQSSLQSLIPDEFRHVSARLTSWLGDHQNSVIQMPAVDDVAQHLCLGFFSVCNELSNHAKVNGHDGLMRGYDRLSRFLCDPGTVDALVPRDHPDPAFYRQSIRDLTEFILSVADAMTSP